MMREELLNDESQVFLSVENGLKSKLRCNMPAIVNSFDPVTQTLNISVAVQYQRKVPSEDGLTTKYEDFTATPLADVPVNFSGSQELMMTHPINAQDSVLVSFCDKSIGNWYQSGGVGVPDAKARSHSFSDGVATAGFRPATQKIQNFNNDVIEFRDASGQNVISLHKNGTINLTSSTTINITAPTININGQTVITGGLTIDGLDFGTHKHTGVQSGGSNTGGPV